MTDKELRDAAVGELKLTTAGWRKSNGSPNYPSGTAPATSHWGKAMFFLDQIANAAPPPPPPPTTGTIYDVPVGIDNTGSQDVTSALQAWWNGIPNGASASSPSRARLRAGIYRIHSMLTLSGGGKFLEGPNPVLGGGATLKHTTPVTQSGGVYSGNDGLRLARFTDMADSGIRYLTLVGASPMPSSGDGFKPWEANVQHLHSLAVSRCKNFLVDYVKVDGSGGGDGINWGNENQGFRSTGTISNSEIINAHRCGIALVGSGGLRIYKTKLDRIGFWWIDLEPNTVESSNYATVVEECTFGSGGGLSPVRCAIGAFAGSKDGKGLCDGLTIRKNVFDRPAEIRLNTNINGGFPYPQRIKNVRIEDNVEHVSGPQWEIRQVDGLDIARNQRSASNPQIGLWSCTDCRIADSTYQAN